MGSGVADAHLATLADILTYDARNLEETLTKDLVRPLQAWNFPGNRTKIKFKIDTESDNVKEKLEAIQTAFNMGLEIRSEDIYKIIAMSRPDADDDVLSMARQQAAAGGGMPGAGLAQPGAGVAQAGQGSVFSLESFHQDFATALQQQKGLSLATAS